MFQLYYIYLLLRATRETKALKVARDIVVNHFTTLMIRSVSVWYGTGINK